MKLSPPTILFLVPALVAITALDAATGNFTGEYADKKFLNGQAVFQLSLEQSGNNVKIFFSAVRHDGQGAAPEADTTGHVTDKGLVEFKFADSLNNSGTGTISRAGEDVVLSIKAMRVADPRCLQFYRANIQLRRVKK